MLAKDFSSRKFLALCSLLIGVVFVWLWFKPYPSHYISGLRTLGDMTTQNYIGYSKEGRGDEWSTYLPMLKQAALEGFPKRSALAPYYERLDWFIAIPKLDATLLFLPNHWIYFIASPDIGLSFQAIYYYLLLLISLVWLMKNFGVSSGCAVGGALCLIFSQFYQVWWTSNFPALGASILPFAILTGVVA